MSDAPPRLLALDHVQLAMPEGGEGAARAFYAGLLGLREVPKPGALARRGGVWFRGGEGLELHLGVEDGFRPARKAHPALRVRGLEAFAARLTGAGVRVRPDEALPGTRRLYVDDPFGNRLELLEPLDAAGETPRPRASRPEESG